MRANISIFSVIRNTGLLFLGMILALGMALFFPDPSFSQEKKQDKLIRFSAYAQFWARYTMMNPGSRINESQVANTADLSLRRFRVKVTANPIDHLMFVVQAGTTNLTSLSHNESPVELLDAYGEYQLNKQLSFGGGRSNWKGLTRFAAGPGSTLLYDVPFLILGNVNRTDLTLRNLNLFAKGQLGALDYRLIVAKPYIPVTAKPQEGIANFNNLKVKPNLSAYVKWQFFEKESNVSPISPGTYLGKKKVLAIGIGAEYQKDLLWSLNSGDTILNSMKLFSADVLFDTPLNKESGTSLNIYAAAFLHDYGPGYLRNLGINNMANGMESKIAAFNGAGNAYPVVGTGKSLILQSGVTLPYFNRRTKKTRLMPAFGIQYSRFDRLSDPMFSYDLGLSLLLKDHSSKFVFNAQSRPIYTSQGTALKVTDRKMMFVLMYHINID